MFTTVALLLTLSAAEPAERVPMLVVTVHGPSQAQLERRGALERARADHEWRLGHALELAKLQAESLAASRACLAKPTVLASDGERAPEAVARVAGAPRSEPVARAGRRTPARK